MEFKEAYDKIAQGGEIYRKGETKYLKAIESFPKKEGRWKIVTCDGGKPAKEKYSKEDVASNDWEVRTHEECEVIREANLAITRRYQRFNGVKDMDDLVGALGQDLFLKHRSWDKHYIRYDDGELVKCTHTDIRDWKDGGEHFDIAEVHEEQEPYKLGSDPFDWEVVNDMVWGLEPTWKVHIWSDLDRKACAHKKQMALLHSKSEDGKVY